MHEGFRADVCLHFIAEGPRNASSFTELTRVMMRVVTLCRKQDLLGYRGVNHDIKLKRRAACKSRGHVTGVDMKRRFTFLAGVGLALASVWYSDNASAQIKILPGSAARGEQLLVEKGCANCHSLDGRGGNGAPDLTRTPPHAGAPGLLASAMWNHAPNMGEQKAEMTSGDAADLFAYMYSALYFAPAGDVSRGKGVFQKNRRVVCTKSLRHWPGPRRKECSPS